MLAVINSHSLRKGDRPIGREGVANKLDTTEHGNFIAATRHDAEREPAGFFVEPVRRQQLGGAFHVPTRAAATQQCCHEGVRPLVKQQMPSVVSSWLVVEPQPTANRNTVDELVTAGRHQAQRVEAAPLAYQTRLRLPVRSLAFVDLEVFSPLWHRLVKHRGKLVDVVARGQVGVQN